MLTTLAGKHWTKMKLPAPRLPREQQVGEVTSASATFFTLLSPPGPPSQILSLSAMSSLVGGGGFAFLLPFAEKSLFSNLHVTPPPQTFWSSLPSNVMPQIGQPYLGPLPLNLFLFSPSSWLIPSLTHHDTNSLYLFSFSWSPSPHI